MTEPSVDVLVAGGGPVGLTVACELRRHGVECRVVDPLAEPPRYAKAVGVQPRTLEVWEDMGILRQALDASIELRGQIVFVNGKEASRLTLELPPEVPFAFVALPQYETERILREHLAGFGTAVERRVSLGSFRQDRDGVTTSLSGPEGEEVLRVRYLVGCDGAHSTVRKGLGLSFEGDAFPEEYMLGDVEVDWSLPPGYGVRSLHETGGETDDLLVCIPLPGRKRYRMSMLVPPDLSAPAGAPIDVGHGLVANRPGPTLEHIQAVLDRLGPEKTIARNLRWSSVFRISHRLVDRYGDGRVFVAGDAAHIHPPTGAQGMNTGIQDAYNLAWKLALAVRGDASSELLASYDAERHPVGEEVVGRTVRDAREGFDESDPRAVVLRMAQLLVGYPDSPLSQEAGWTSGGPRPGERAPDARGLRRDAAAFPLRLFELLRGTDPVLLLYAHRADVLPAFEELEAVGRRRAHGHLSTYAVLGSEVGEAVTRVPALRDASGEFAAAYGVSGGEGYVIRPDGYVGFRSSTPDAARLEAYLACLFA